MKESELTFSVVVCVFNGAQSVAHTLQSLQKQTFPKNSFEIVAVNDGSTDGTAEVLAEFQDVRIVTHPENRGHSAARNTGFEAARGRYIAYIDADCIAQPAWLAELKKALSQPNTMAAGGQIAPLAQKYIAQRYLVRSGYGRPAALQLGQTKTPWQRLKAYVRDKFSQASEPKLQASDVCEAYGANAVFERAKLQAVKGFPLELRTSEDAAICQRLRAKFPKQTIRFTPRAVVKHAFVPTFGVYLREIFHRQTDTLAYYRSLQKMPPVFPFPLGVIAGAALAALLNPLLGLAALLALPLAAYAWWLVAALKRRSVEYLAYVYMQFAEELTRDAGLITAGLRSLMRPYPHILAAVLLLGAGLFGVHGASIGWLKLPVAFGVIFVPGYLILLALSLHQQLTAPFKRLAFMAMFGVLWNMVIGLAAVIFLPLNGDNRPLESQAVLGVYGIGMALLVLAAVTRRRVVLPARSTWNSGSGAAMVWLMAFALPFGAVAGANLLNRGGGWALAYGVLAVGAVLLLVTALRAERLPASTMPLVLFSVSLSALLSYTMRSSHLFGWDIQQEYEVFLHTGNVANWVIGQVHNPYDAMLSLTVLPNVLNGLSGLSGLAIFKLLFPTLFSFVPVMLYYIYRLWARRWIAFVAAAVFIAQFYYLQEFAALARQQLAFLFFAGLLYVLLQQRLRGKRRFALIVMLIAGMVVSHYSTTYMAIGLLAGAFVLTKLFLLARSRWHFSALKARVIPLWVVLAMVVGAWAWYGPATHSHASFSQVNGAAGGQQESIFASIASKVEDKLADKSAAAEPVNAGTYLQNIGKDHREDRGYLNYYAGASNAGIQPAAAAVIPDKFSGASVLATLADTALRFAWWILGALGALWFMLRAWKRRAFHNAEAVMLAGVALIAFAVIHAVPEIGQHYNIPRLNQQALMFVALPAIAVLAWLFSKYLKGLQRFAVTAPLVVAFLIATGILSQTIGGRPHANLNNFGIDYQHFYIHDSEVAAAQWLESDRGPRRDAIYADRYANLRLVVPTTINGHVMSDITPETLARYAYVYAGQTNIVDGVTMAGYKGSTVTVQFPREFIEARKNTLYANDFTRVYK